MVGIFSGHMHQCLQTPRRKSTAIPTQKLDIESFYHSNSMAELWAMAMTSVAELMSMIFRPLLTELPTVPRSWFSAWFVPIFFIRLRKKKRNLLISIIKIWSRPESRRNWDLSDRACAVDNSWPFAMILGIKDLWLNLIQCECGEPMYQCVITFPCVITIVLK